LFSIKTENDALLIDLFPIFPRRMYSIGLMIGL
jgi:hypothetical protein